MSPAMHRVNESILGLWERPALAWLVARIPAGVTPDHLTALGVCGALLTGMGFVLALGSLNWLWLSSLGLCLNWFGDSLDGTLARYRRVERPRFGFFIDHTTDLFCQALMFLALAVSPLAHFGVACVGLITFLMAFVFTLITAHTHSRMRITYLFFGPTEIRALLLLGNLLVLTLGPVDLALWLPPGVRVPFTVSPHDAVIALMSMAGVAALLWFAYADGRALYKEEPPRTS